MADMNAPFDPADALMRLDAAALAKQLSPSAVANIRVWLTEPRYAAFAPQVAEHLTAARWRELDDVFWTVIPFGTGGRRGKMYPIGSNAINERTIGESAQGLADYVNQWNGVNQVHGVDQARGVKQGDAANPPQAGSPLSCAIAYDTRHRSRQFAELCAEVMVAAGFKVYFLDGYRSTPELSCAVRYKKCSCGIMVTASHNPPSDNAVKAYWSTGGQLLPPHDRGVIDRVMNVDVISRVPFAAAVASGQVVCCQEEVDAVYIREAKAQAQAGPRALKIIYSPLHGAGASAVLPILAADGFSDVELFSLHAEPNGDFPNVPGHVSNPENPAIFDAIIARGQEIGADLALASDPDCDRLGVAAPRSSTSPRGLSGTPSAGAWGTFTGNQIGALLTEFLLERRKAAGGLTREHFVVKTLVTTELIRRIADAYGVQTKGDLQVGFKYIGGLIEDVGTEKFVFGAEESHGYLAGGYARDKDAGVAAMLMAELAAQTKAAGRSLHEQLDALFWQYGCHAEKQISVTMPGSEGMTRMAALMRQFREHPPAALAGMKVVRARDYLALMEVLPAGQNRPFDGPPGDMVMLDLAIEGTYVGVRPSGTEPKVKYYLFTYEPAEMLANLEATKSELAERLNSLGKALTDFSQAAG